MQVALLNPCFWPEVRRGSERFLRELADGLIARGHRPRLITSHPGPSARSVEDGLPIVRLRRPPQGRLQLWGYEDYLTHVPLSYMSLVRGEDDVAHALYPTDALVAARWSRRTGRPALLSYMGIPSRDWLEERRWRPAITRRAVERCDAVVALSQTAAQAFRDVLGVEARVIAPGVDLEVFRPGAPRAAEPTIFCAAALDRPRKRVPLLVEAFAHVRRERPDARLVLSRPSKAAGASDAREVAAAGQAVARTKGIELRDVDDRGALAAAYCEAWVSVLPSLGEAFGLVLLEALACGTPVVGTRDASLPELVDSEAIGRLFDGEAPEALARTILEALALAEDPATSEACRRRAGEFSIERCVAAYESLYEELRMDESR